MGRISRVFLGLALIAGGGLVGEVTAAAPAPIAALGELRFERNDGQARSSAPFVARGPGYTLLLEPQAATLALRASGARPHTLRLELLGAASTAAIEGARLLSAKSNYLVGGPARWRSGVPLYGEVRARDVYPGIDMVYYGRDGELEYDFVVAPGADPRQIRLRFAGAQRPVVDDGGTLHLKAGTHALRQPTPVVYQTQGATRTAVDGRYAVAADGTVGFELAAYDPTRPLVIDPILTYGTLLGGSSEDIAIDVATDAAGNAYAVGVTSSIDLPATEGAYNTTSGGAYSTDGFVAKFDPTGTQLVYLTYLRGEVSAVQVDGLGQAHVAGLTDGMPTTPGAYGSGNSCYDSFVAKLSADGAALLYSACLTGTEGASDLALGADGTAYVGGYTVNPTREAYVAKLSADGAELGYLRTFGGDSFDAVTAIAVDDLGNAYATGVTGDGAVDFATTSGAYDETHGGNGEADAFVVKLDATGADVYATLVGGADWDEAQGLALADDGAVYIGGRTGLGFERGVGDFPVTPGAWRTSFEGQIDGFVAKLDASGASLQWATFVNPDTAPTANAAEEVFDVALGASGLYVVGGIGIAAPFPVTSGALDESPDGPDAFLLLLSDDGTRAIYASYLGGGATDTAYGVTVDAFGNAYVVGATSPSETSFPTTPGAYDMSYNSTDYAHDAFVVKLPPIVDSTARFPVATVDLPADAATVQVDVVREGDAQGAFQVDYTATLDGTVVANGTLDWADQQSGEQPVEIVLPSGGKSGNAAKAASGQVVITLSQPSGRLVGARSMQVSVGGGSSGGAFGTWILMPLGLAFLWRRRRA